MRHMAGRLELASVNAPITCGGVYVRPGDGIVADEERCRRYAEISPSLATALNPIVGYKQAAEIVKQALKEGRTIPEVTRDLGIIDEDTLRRALDPATLTEPGIPGSAL